MKVIYWWTEDGDNEICERTDRVLEKDGECYHCAKKLYKGDKICMLKVLDDKDTYVLCKQCEENNTQEI